MEHIIEMARTQLKIGVQSKSVINEQAKELGYRKVSQAGLHCIDYNINWTDLNEEIEYDHFREHKKLADQHQITFSQVHGPRITDLKLPEDLEDFIAIIYKSIDVCTILQAPFLVVHPIKRMSYMSYEDAWELNIKFFTRIAEYAASRGVIICIEYLQDRFHGKVVDGIGSSATDIRRMIAQVGERVQKDCIGACFDVGHANILRKDLASEVDILGDYLKVLHIHDNNGDSDDHQLPYSFTSPMTRQPTTDWSGLLVALRRSHYSGVLSFETYAALVAIPALEQIELLKYLCSIGRHFSHIICYETILEQVKDKEIVVFGSGKMLDSYMRDFGQQYKPNFVVDNNARLWGSNKLGLSIKSPAELTKEHVVIICNQYYEEVMMQLENMGITKYILNEEIYRMAGRP